MNASKLTELCEEILKADTFINRIKVELGTHQETRNRAEKLIVTALQSHRTQELAISLSTGLHRLTWTNSKLSIIPMIIIGDQNAE